MIEDRDRETEAGVEPDETPTRAVAAVVAAITVVVALLAVGLWQLFGLTTITEIRTKNLEVENQELIELRAREWGRLTQYERIDSGVYQIPIERAMDKLVANPRLIEPLAVGPTAVDAGTSDAAGDGSTAGFATDASERHEPAVPASARAPAAGSAAPGNESGP